METEIRGWCGDCATQHRLAATCPGDLPITGAERHGWCVNARTPSGIETYGVLLAPSHKLWRARIMTYPNILWLVPGGRQTMKFVGLLPEEAERKAAQFIIDFCRQRGYDLRREVEQAEPAPVSSRSPRAPRASQAPQAPPVQDEPAPRKVRFLPVRFGVVSPSESAGTGNLSETGLFIITEAPLESSTQLVIKLNAGDSDVAMKGHVRWRRKQHPAGGTPGMGVQLLAPPPNYVDYVRTLE